MKFTLGMEPFPSTPELVSMHSVDSDDIQKIQYAANKSLERIQSLYQEIMAPSQTSLLPLNFEIGDTNVTPAISQEVNFNTRYRTCRQQNQKPQISHCCLNTASKVNLSSNQENFHRHSMILAHRENDFNFFHSPKCQPRNINRKSYLSNPHARFKVTVPQPFALSSYDPTRQLAKEAKMFKLKEEQDSRVLNEMKVRPLSKPVPKHTNLPLYDQMVLKNEKRRTERKEKSVEITKNCIQPFNLSSSLKTIGRTKSLSNLNSEESKFIFKAKPAPKHILSSQISERLKNQEEMRKMLIAQRAEDILKKSSSPFSEKLVNRSYSMVNLKSATSEKETKRAKVNLSAITNRLYVKKCKETMNEWNKKVLEFDSCRDKKFKTNNLQISKKTLPVSSLPFTFFPVRMSNAAIAREKQIREGIIARTRRVKTKSDSEEELARRKKEALQEILPRLKSLIPAIDSQKEIEEKVKSFRVTQINRQHEYEKELQEIMMRVSKQLLLIERQSQAKRKSPKEDENGEDSIDSNETESGSNPPTDVESRSEAESNSKSLSEET